MVSQSPNFFILSRRAADLDAIEDAFPGHLKLRSICWLLRVRARTTEGVVLANTSAEALDAALKFARSRNWERFMLRHDSLLGRPRSVQGGFLINFNEIGLWVERFVQGGICMLLEPLDPLLNGYNISCLIDKNSTIIEIAGPGFDASDLQRGQIRPHEVRPLNRFGNLGDPTFTDTSSYLEAVNVRELKIWWKLKCRELATEKWRELTSDEIDQCRAFIFAARGTSIPLKYEPIPIPILQKYIQTAGPLIADLRKRDELPAVLASSFVQGNELVFWDVNTQTRWTGRTGVQTD